ncbi:hypothetical protein NDU88_002797 [Pleurodeles waltl]|uniref:Uncharacterized protein n=1 Tax=Pleurodeles waltl TaxID=8319 RepID=A0AAV7LET0_PLEWA|nr:hypothetical protein NDU88_002797 [Pleurodeles waltl]
MQAGCSGCLQVGPQAGAGQHRSRGSRVSPGAVSGRRAAVRGTVPARSRRCCGLRLLSVLPQCSGCLRRLLPAPLSTKEYLLGDMYKQSSDAVSTSGLDGVQFDDGLCVTCKRQ